MTLPVAAAAEQSQAVQPQATLTRPFSQTRPPPGHELSARGALSIARSSEKVRSEVARHPGAHGRAFVSGPSTWQVSYYVGGEEVVQVVVDERRRAVTEVWTGPQIAWQMARGLPGAFGRKVNAPYIWIPLMIAFAAPFVDWRRPFRLLHLDLLMLLAFSLSHLYFNRGEIFTSVPLVYPVLSYLLLRMLLFGFVRRFREERPPFRPRIPAAYVALALVFLIGFRIGLNLTNSNVIDVGYSGVIGADRITHGKSPYGNFPNDDASGDTYGPVTYYAYVPFELVFPWSGKWDDLPAAHAAALFFDLATMLGLFALGRQLLPRRAGNRLGLMLAYGWAAYPYTLFVSNSNTNDSLVAMLLVYTFLALNVSRMRGALLALASAAKFAPLALVPLMAGYSRSRKTALRFAAAFIAVFVIVVLPVLLGSGISTFWDRTIGFQLGRDSPFSIWGQHGNLGWLQTAAKVLAAGLAIAVAFVPRRKSVLQTAALGAAVIIAVEITLTHWFYLYIVWFFPLVLIALLGQLDWDEPTGAESGRGQHEQLDRFGEPAAI